MIIRVLTKDDLLLWRGIWLEALEKLPETFLTTLEEERAKPEEDVARQLSKGQNIGLFDGADLAAALSVDPEIKPALAHRAWINAFYVRPKWQGTDVAHRLLQAAIAKARSAGYVQLELFVASDNQHAIRFYERAGFVRHGRLPRAVRLPDRYQDDLHYVYQIEG